MPTITALLHTHNDALRLGRCLEMLYACDDVLILDHDSQDHTRRIAREYGAHIVPSPSSEPIAAPSELVAAGWIFCIDPCESVSESLSASLYECRSGSIPMQASASFSMLIREETTEGWQDHHDVQTRLVPASWNLWSGRLPARDQNSQLLQGALLRFAFP